MTKKASDIEQGSFVITGHGAVRVTGFDSDQASVYMTKSLSHPATMGTGANQQGTVAPIVKEAVYHGGGASVDNESILDRSSAPFPGQQAPIVRIADISSQSFVYINEYDRAIADDVGVEVIGRRINALYVENEELKEEQRLLKSEIKSLREDIHAQTKLMSSLLQKIEGENAVEAEGTVEIDWSNLQSVIESGFDAFGWKPLEMSFDEEQSFVSILMPEGQGDLVAETTLDFYSYVAQRVHKEEFKQIQFDIDCDVE